MQTLSKTSTWDEEKEHLRKGFSSIVGIDEVGRGPLAGPVVACALSLKANQCLFDKKNREFWESLRDSKQLSHTKREGLFLFLEENFFIGIGRVSAETIDRINILQATFLAMKTAIAEWKRVSSYKTKDKQEKVIFLVDGDKEIPHITIEQCAIVGGDKKVKSIACASIVAKVLRDREMILLDKTFPSYGFAHHKGYGTREHMEALRRFGPIAEHRQSFAPVKKCLRELRSYGVEI